MAGTESENGEHSTAANDPLTPLRWRFFGSLVLCGLLLGLMIGRLTTPEPARLIEVQTFETGLRLRLNVEADYREAFVEGAYALQLQAQGREAAGQLRLDGQRIHWRVQPAEQGLALRLVALRPLQVLASGRQEGSDWLLELRVATEGDGKNGTLSSLKRTEPQSID